MEGLQQELVPRATAQGGKARLHPEAGGGKEAVGNTDGSGPGSANGKSVDPGADL